MVAVNAGTTIRGVLATTAVARINVGFSALTNAAGKIVAIVSLSTCVANYVASNFGISMPIATFSEKCDGPSHRGRWQAQGGGLNESEPWAKHSPLTLSEGLALLDKLEAKLKPSDRRARAVYFEQARLFAKRVSIKGGLSASEFRGRSFPDGPLGSIARVDLEIRAGRAFVPDAQ